MELLATSYVQQRLLLTMRSKQVLYFSINLIVIDIDLVGTFNMSRAAFEHISKTKGTIINISATLHYHSTRWQSHASSAKAGVDALTTSLANEWGDFGIRVNGIAPGMLCSSIL